MNTLLLKNVFTPGGQPSVTYVSRDHLGLEKRVKDALVRGYSINVVTGPTKSGKTVLCNHVLGQAGASVSIEGGQVRGEADFWDQIMHSLGLAVQRTRKEVGANNDNVDVSVGLNFFLVQRRGRRQLKDRFVQLSEVCLIILTLSRQLWPNY